MQMVFNKCKPFSLCVYQNSLKIFNKPIKTVNYYLQRNVNNCVFNIFSSISVHLQNLV